MSEPVERIQAMIEAVGATWVPGETPLSTLSVEERASRLGLVPPPGERERIVQIRANAYAFPAAFAPRRDWRNNNGQNWISAIRDQGDCGSCVAFATAATLEAQARIQLNKLQWDINLSESDLFFCGGRTCNEGWWPPDALDYVKANGIADEACFPYQDHDIPCNDCADRNDHLLTLASWQELVTADQRKSWLDTKGPVIACFAVYNDFFSYKHGVYRHVTGDLAGYHAVSCVGYDEDEGCWICKNQWGENWGDNGYFKIAYGEAGMDTEFAMYGVEGIGGTLKPPADDDTETGKGTADYVSVEHSFEANQSIVWAQVNGKWRCVVVNDDQLIALNGLMFGSDVVEASFSGDRLTNLRGLKKQQA